MSETIKNKEQKRPSKRSLQVQTSLPAEIKKAFDTEREKLGQTEASFTRMIIVQALREKGYEF